MLRKTSLLSAMALSMAVALPAAAQDKADRMAEALQSLPEEDQAAREMMARIYIYDPVTFKLPSQVIANLRERGHTDIDDVDIEYNAYEIEAVSPDGNEVELEIDPISGAIRDIDENWF